MESTQPQIRQRVNIAQTAKGLHQVEVTYESVADLGIDPILIANEALQLVKSIEAKLKADGRKLVTDSE
jgi:hypothetical protein